MTDSPGRSRSGGGSFAIASRNGSEPTYAGTRTWAARLAVAYAALIVYGSLFPFDFSAWPDWDEIVADLARVRVSRTDVLSNVVFYLPLGFLTGVALQHRRMVVAFVVSVACGVVLSTTVEILQLVVPRVTSPVDVAANALGTLLGAVAAVTLKPGLPVPRFLRALRSWGLRPGRLPEIGAITVLLWTASQLSPFVPSLDFENLKKGLRPLWYALQDPGRIELWRLASYGLAICGLGLLLRRVARPVVPVSALFAAFVATLLSLKVPILSRQLGPEALLGGVLGVSLATWAGRWTERRASLLAASALLLAFATATLAPSGTSQSLSERMNWIPFGSSRRDLHDISDILGTAWIFWGLGYLVRSRLAEERRPARAVAVVGGAVVFVFALLLESAQLMIPGRVPDVTDAVVALAGWIGPWIPGLPPDLRAGGPTAGPKSDECTPRGP